MDTNGDVEEAGEIETQGVHAHTTFGSVTLKSSR